MDQAYSRTLHVRWGDLDSNGHLANTAYLDACVDVRMMHFADFETLEPRGEREGS